MNKKINTNTSRQEDRMMKYMLRSISTIWVILACLHVAGLLFARVASLSTMVLCLLSMLAISATAIWIVHKKYIRLTKLLVMSSWILLPILFLIYLFENDPNRSSYYLLDPNFDLKVGLLLLFDGVLAASLTFGSMYLHDKPRELDKKYLANTSLVRPITAIVLVLASYSYMMLGSVLSIAVSDLVLWVCIAMAAIGTLLSFVVFYKPGLINKLLFSAMIILGLWTTGNLFFVATW